MFKNGILTVFRSDPKDLQQVAGRRCDIERGVPAMGEGRPAVRAGGQGDGGQVHDVILHSPEGDRGRRRVGRRGRGLGGRGAKGRFRKGPDVLGAAERAPLEPIARLPRLSVAARVGPAHLPNRLRPTTLAPPDTHSKSALVL